jgi:hypothetical protein
MIKLKLRKASNTILFPDLLAIMIPGQKNVESDLEIGRSGK